MDILRSAEKIFIRLFLIVSFLPLQSCSNTLIGERLENSFDTTENLITSEKINNQKRKSSGISKIKSKMKAEEKENAKDFGNIMKVNSIANKDRLIQKQKKLVKKAIFTPQPYRIILRLSGANPSAPAESVTEALRKAGVEFEVEKIERFNDGDISKDRSFKR